MPLNLKLVIANVIYTVQVSGFLTLCDPPRGDDPLGKE